MICSRRSAVNPNFPIGLIPRCTALDSVNWPATVATGVQGRRCRRTVMQPGP